MKIPFDTVSLVHNEKNVNKTIDSGYLRGSGRFEDECASWFRHNVLDSNFLVMHSYVYALKIMVISMGINGGDEVIMTSDII